MADLQRRRLIRAGSALLAATVLGLDRPLAAPGVGHTRVVPSTGERIPAIGMGTWITFDVGQDPAGRAVRTEVLRTFFSLGGTVVDSSPMYGSAPDVIGHALDRLDNDRDLFAASKIWIPGRERGIHQMEYSRQRWGIERFDLMQVHNMVDWRTHLDTLLDWKDQGRVRYIGITTSHGRRHREMEHIIANEPFDFVQFTYNIADREAERRLLPMAANHGKAVIINRPFRTGGLFRMVRGKPLPPWAGEIGCRNWAQFFLKFIVSHPAVTCPIPATSRVDHMRENMGALSGPLPDSAARERMADYFRSL